MTIAAVKPTHLEVDLATNEGIVTVSWYDVRKVFSHWAFISVTSGPSRGMMGWVELSISFNTRRKAISQPLAMIIW